MVLQVVSDTSSTDSDNRKEFPKPFPMLQLGCFDENSAENITPQGSPMMLTPKPKDKDSIVRSPYRGSAGTRSPLKRTRMEIDWDTEPLQESPKKKRALAVERSSTFPSNLKVIPDSSTTSSKSSSHRGFTGNLSKSFGSKASSVKNLFRGEKKKNFVPDDQQSLRASILSLLMVHKSQFVVLEQLLKHSGSVPAKQEELMEDCYEFFHGHQQVKRLIDFVIEKEVEETSSNTTLFRETSCATKLIALVLKKEIQQKLESALYPHIKDIISSPDSYEIDPDRLSESISVEKNQNNLIAKCADILCSVNTLLNEINLQLSYIMKVIHSKVSAKWTSVEGKIAVTSFFFLRYVCPSLVTPSNIDITSAQRRSLILISKVLQSLSNNTNFSEKEEYMQCLDQSLEDLSPLMDKFFNTLRNSRMYEPEISTKGPKYFIASDNLQRRIISHQYAIRQQLTSSEYIAEFEEAISMFTSSKARQIMKEVTQDLKKRGDQNNNLKKLLSPRGLR